MYSGKRIAQCFAMAAIISAGLSVVSCNSSDSNNDEEPVLQVNTPASDLSSASIEAKKASYGNYVTATKEDSTDNLNSTEVITKEAVSDDLNDQTYSMFEGLEEYRDTYLTKIGSSENTLNDQWSYDTTSELADVENLVKVVRNNNASTSPAKKYYKYPRPFRWDVTTEKVINETNEDGSYKVADGQVASDLVSRIKADPSNDGGFPSGHTNAAYLTSFALAYAVPQKYDALIMRAAKLGYNRVVAGMHSPLDVIGGRMTATAVAANALYKSSNADTKNTAYEKAQSGLIGSDWSNTAATEDEYNKYKVNLETYAKYSTFDFTKISSSAEEMIVPLGAEVLLETRFPYLDSDQIRWILHSTGFESGYPVMDDDEGWGRLNLYKASHGYATFDNDVTVMMNAENDGYNALDNWMNDIDGSGSLIKTGSGTLVLAGNNSYTGNTTVAGGILIAANENAFGKGSLYLAEGMVSENTDNGFAVNGSYYQISGTLNINVKNCNDFMNIKNKAYLGGDLIINLDDYEPEQLTVLKYGSYSGHFNNITIKGSSSTYNAYYTDEGIFIKK